MKKEILISFVGLFLSGCATMQSYKSEDAVPSGFKYKYGPMTSAKVGDKVVAYNKVDSVSRRGFSYKEIGKLTIVQTFADHAIMQKDGDFNISEKTAFLKE